MQVRLLLALGALLGCRHPDVPVVAHADSGTPELGCDPALFACWVSAPRQDPTYGSVEDVVAFHSDGTWDASVCCDVIIGDHTFSCDGLDIIDTTPGSSPYEGRWDPDSDNLTWLLGTQFHRVGSDVDPPCDSL